eukprot:747282-Hanusia_phi.AAC.1
MGKLEQGSPRDTWYAEEGDQEAKQSVSSGGGRSTVLGQEGNGDLEERETEQSNPLHGYHYYTEMDTKKNSFVNPAKSPRN